MTHALGTTHSISIDELNTYTNNPRHGDIAALVDSLETNGQFRPIVVNKGTKTGRHNEVLAGNHTLMAARRLDERGKDFRFLDCYVIDVDDDAATRIVLADNRTSDLAAYDDLILTELLESLDDLDGTGYTEDDLLPEDFPPDDAPTVVDDDSDDEGASSSSRVDRDNDPTKDTVTYGDADVEAQPMNYAIVVECDDEATQRELLTRFLDEGLTCRAIM